MKRWRAERRRTRRPATRREMIPGTFFSHVPYDERPHVAAAARGVVSERPSDYFFRRFVKSTRMSRTEIMPTNFPPCVTPRCRICVLAIRSLTSNRVLSSSIVRIGADIIFSAVVVRVSTPAATTRRTISVSVRIPTISVPFVTNRLLMRRSRIIRAAVCTSVARSTVINFSLGTMNDLIRSMHCPPLANSVHHPLPCRLLRPIHAESRIVAIDWVKRIVGIIGSLGNLVWTSLLQNRGRIHHSVEDVGALCEERAIQRQSIWCAGVSCLSRSSNQTNESDQTNQIDQMNQLPAMRRGMSHCKTLKALPQGRSSHDLG